MLNVFRSKEQKSTDKLVHNVTVFNLLLSLEERGFCTMAFRKLMNVLVGGDHLDNF